MGLEKINKAFSNYFHPESLWKQGNAGKAKAVGAVISWGTLILPVIMGIGLAISTSRLRNMENRAFSTKSEDVTSNKVDIAFENAKLTPEKSDSSELKPAEEILPKDEEVSITKYYNDISTYIDEGTKDPKKWLQFHDLMRKTASGLNALNIKFDEFNFPSHDSSSLEGAWIVKAIVWLGGYSTRMIGGAGFDLSMRQASFHIEKLMIREDKVELIKQIKAELERLHSAIKTSRNNITPYTSFITNMDFIESKSKNEFLGILDLPIVETLVY